MSRPRVVIGTWFYDDQAGWQDLRLRIESLGRHCDVTLVLRAERFRPHLPGVQARIVVLDAPPGRRSMLRFIWRLAGLARAARPDLVYLLGSQLALCTLLLGSRRSALYWNEHPTHVFLGSTSGRARRALGRLMVALSFAAARRAALVTPIGEAQRDDLFDHGVAPARVELVPMGVDDRFAAVRPLPPPTASDAVTAVYAGTVSAERGRDVMIEGLARATRQGANLRLLVVGASAEQRRYCAARAAQLGVAERLEVVGRVPGSEIPTYLARAHLGVCLWAETIWWRFNPPTKLFEYLAAGLPVLASRIRTHTAYIRDGVNGMVFDYAPDGFASALMRAWRERARLPVLSANAAHDGQRYLWSTVEPQFLGAMWRALDTVPPTAGPGGCEERRPPPGDRLPGDPDRSPPC